MRPSALIRLAVAGTKTDRVRVTLTALGSTAAVVAWLSAATVASLGVSLSGAASDDHYTTDVISQPGLRPGVIATFVLLTIPVLALVAQCARLGAPARDRRIAAIRLAGATPRQTVAIGAGESGVSAMIGSLLGLAAFLILRHALDHPDHDGRRALPTDVMPAIWVIVAICVLLPIVVTLTSAWLLRRVTTTPLGVVRRVARRRGPRPWPGLLIVVGVGLFAVLRPVGDLLARHHVDVPNGALLIAVYGGVLLAAAGVALGAGWIAYAAGRLLGRSGPSPASQLAAARLIADPWQGSRTFGVLTIATLFGAGTAGVYANLTGTLAAQTYLDRSTAALQHQDFVPESDHFYTNTLLLVAIAVGIAVVIAALGQLTSLTEAIVSRRRTNAALVATGVPRSVLVRATVWQTFSVAVPAIVIATVAGLEITREFMGTSTTDVGGQVQAGDGPLVTVPTITRVIAVPWSQLGLVVGGSLAAVALTVGIGLLFLKASTSVEELRTT